MHDDFRFPVLKKVLGDLSELFPLTGHKAAEANAVSLRQLSGE